MTTTKLQIGVFGGDTVSEGNVKLLVDGDKTFDISEELWHRIEKKLLECKKVPLKVNVELSGNRVMKVGSFESEVAE